MPELPEVESVTRTLNRLINKKFSSVEILTEKLKKPIQKDLELKLKNNAIKDIYRRGKYIIFQLEKGYIVSHLGMTGKFLVNILNDKHTHIIMKFEDGTVLVYSDIRKFGFLTYEDNLNIKSLESLGVDPLTDDFNTEDFYKETSKSEKDIKDFLMAQNIVSGLGNIYVNETMYLAGINPLTKMNTLSKKQVDNIVKITKEILRKSINLGGSSISDYVNADNEKGKFQNHFNVYKRSEDRFGNKVEKISQSGRATYYAPALQK